MQSDFETRRTNTNLKLMHDQKQRTQDMHFTSNTLVKVLSWFVNKGHFQIRDVKLIAPTPKKYSNFALLVKQYHVFNKSNPSGSTLATYLRSGLPHSGGNKCSFIYLPFLGTPVASSTKEVNPRLGNCPLVFNGHLANQGLTSLVKEATDHWHRI